MNYATIYLHRKLKIQAWLISIRRFFHPKVNSVEGGKVKKWDGKLTCDADGNFSRSPHDEFRAFVLRSCLVVFFISEFLMFSHRFTLFHLQHCRIDQPRRRTEKQAFRSTAMWSRSSSRCATQHSLMTSRSRYDFHPLTLTSTKITRFCIWWRWCSWSWTSSRSSTLHRWGSANGSTKSTSTTTTFLSTTFGTASACHKWCVNQDTTFCLLRNFFAIHFNGRK